MPFAAFLDANALWSAAVRDTILRAAEQDLFRPVWTEQILEELARSLKRERPDIDPARFDRLLDQMLRAFPQALVENYQDLIPVMRNDEGDRHVLAAAVRAGADAIVTWNAAHFPAEACAPYSIAVQTPDEFLSHLWHLSPEDMASILERQADALAKPAMTARQVVEVLRRSVPRFAEIALRSGLIG